MTKAKKAKANGTRKQAFRDEQKIHLLVKENPRRKTAATYKIFAVYRNGMTVGDFIKKGGRMIDVVADVDRKHIKVG